jgi:hypothetical protein
MLLPALVLGQHQYRHGYQHLSHTLYCLSAGRFCSLPDHYFFELSGQQGLFSIFQETYIKKNA